MPTQTLSGTLILPGIELSGDLEVLTPNPGPLLTRQSNININIDFKGHYFDELMLEKNDVFQWSAAGFKYVDRPGTGLTDPGQSNRYWAIKGLEIGYNQYVDLDLYAFLSLDAGKGYGTDQLGLRLIMQQITMVLIRNRKNGSSLTIGGAAVKPWTGLLSGTATLPSGYRFFCQTRNQEAWDVNENTSRYLRLASEGTTCTVDVKVAGRYTSAS